MPVRGTRDENGGEFTRQPFQYGGQWWIPADPANDVSPEYLDGIFQNYGMDLRPRDVGGVLAQPYDDFIRFQQQFSPDPGYLREVLPFLLAVGGGVAGSLGAGAGAVAADAAGSGGAATAGATGTASLPAGISYTASAAPEATGTLQIYQTPVSMGAGAAGGAAAGGAAGTGALTLPTLSQVAQGASLLGGASTIANAVGGDSSPAFDIYGASREASPYLDAAMNNTGSMTGNSLNTYNGIVNPNPYTPSGSAVLNGSSWGDLAKFASAASSLPSGGGATKGFWDSVLTPQNTLGAGAALISAGLGATAAQRAADTQAAASDRALAQAKGIYDTTRADLEPWRTAGTGAVGTLSDLLKPGGSLMKTFTGADLPNDPGYQFGLSEGEKAINRAALAGGRYLGGRTLKELTRYGTDYAGTKFNEAFQRDSADKTQKYGFLSGLSSQGANAAALQGNQGANFSNTAAGLMTGGANANAAGTVGTANAVSNSLSQFINGMNSRDLLNALLKNNRGTSVVGAQ